jgi:hypothetical protein
LGKKALKGKALVNHFSKAGKQKHFDYSHTLGVCSVGLLMDEEMLFSLNIGFKHPDKQAQSTSAFSVYCYLL